MPVPVSSLCEGAMLPRLYNCLWVFSTALPLTFLLDVSLQLVLRNHEYQWELVFLVRVCGIVQFWKVCLSLCVYVCVYTVHTRIGGARLEGCISCRLTGGRGSVDLFGIWLAGWLPGGWLLARGRQKQAGWERAERSPVFIVRYHSLPSFYPPVTTRLRTNRLTPCAQKKRKSMPPHPSFFMKNRISH